MPLNLSGDETLDLWHMTRRAEPFKGEFNVLFDRHGFPIMDQWFTNGALNPQGGTEIEYQMTMGSSGVFRMIEPSEDRTYAVGNLQRTLKAPWRIGNTYYVTNRDEVLRNAPDDAKLLDLLRQRRGTAMLSAAEGMETKALRAPASSSDNKNPWGVAAWVVPANITQQTAFLAGTATPGQSGANCFYQDGTEITAGPGGVDSDASNNTLHRNYIASWADSSTTLSENDTDTINTMMMNIGFKSPELATDIGSTVFNATKFYAGVEFIVALARQARANNDSLGTDLSVYLNRVFLNGLPVIRLDDLDAANVGSVFAGGATATITSNVLLGLNHNDFMAFVQAGQFFRENPPENTLAKPDDFVTNVDIRYNFLCKNRRTQGIITWATAA